MTDELNKAGDEDNGVTFNSFRGKRVAVEKGVRIPYIAYPPPPGYKHVSDEYGETLTVPIDLFDTRKDEWMR